MTTLALAAALAALIVVGVLAVGAWRARDTRLATERKLERALAGMAERMDELSLELAGAIDRVQAEARRARAIDELGRSLDLDEVLARTVEAACALPGADAAAVRFAGEDDDPLAAARGITPTPACVQDVPGPPDGSTVRAVALSYHYHPGSEPATPLRSAIAVPLHAAGDRIGFLAVYARSEDASIGAEAFAMLETIAEHAGPALGNAFRFRQASRRAASGELAVVPRRRAFHESLVRELDRAHRLGHPLSLLLVDIDGLGALTAARGTTVGEKAIAELEEALRGAIRDGDLVYQAGIDAFAVILGGAGRIEAEAQFARVQATLRRSPRRTDFPLAVSGGIGEMRADDDAVALHARADAALRRAKDAGKGTAA